jgi:shikimate kinase
MKIYLVGYMGSGKTTNGRQLARRLHMDFLDLDEFIERTYRISIPLFFGKYDEKAFRTVERESLHKTLSSDNIVISTGGGTPCFFDNMDWMNQNGLTVYLKMHPKSLYIRLTESKKTRPLIKQKPEAELTDFIMSSLEYRETFYSKAAITVKGESLDIDQLAGELLNVHANALTRDIADQYISAFEKLRINPELPLLVANAPREYLEELRRFNELTREAGPANDPGKFGFVQLFVNRKTELEEMFPKMLERYNQEGHYWICYPRKSSGIESDLDRNESWNILKKFDYRPVASISVDETWSAIRVRQVSQVKSKERKNIPEVNYEKREVYPPDDLKSALQNEGLLEVFDRLSFTHKREHVEAIVEAKKPETRERRILKTIEMLTKK